MRGPPISGCSNASIEEMGRNYAERIDLAIVHANDEPDRLKHRASKAFRDLRLRESIELYRAYLAERPGDYDATSNLLFVAASTSDMVLLTSLVDAIWPVAQVRVDMAIQHGNWAHRTPDKARAADQALMLARRWPDDYALLYQVHRTLLWDRRVDDARAVLERMRSLTAGADAWSLIPPSRQACAEGRRAEVEDALTRTPDDDLAQRWHLLMLLGRVQEANEPLQALERAGNTYALVSFLVYPQFDPRPFPSLMAVLQRERIDRPPPLPLPFACPGAESSG
jgi:hypothetical protein